MSPPIRKPISLSIIHSPPNKDMLKVNNQGAAVLEKATMMFFICFRILVVDFESFSVRWKGKIAKTFRVRLLLVSFIPKQNYVLKVEDKYIL